MKWSNNSLFSNDKYISYDSESWVIVCVCVCVCVCVSSIKL
jgi:hypothetical protein